jgi:hypothetical protein
MPDTAAELPLIHQCTRQPLDSKEDGDSGDIGRRYMHDTVAGQAARAIRKW